MRSALLALVLFAAAPAEAQGTLVVVLSADDLASHGRAARRGARHALGASHAGDRTLDGSCDPSDAGCVATIARGTHADRVLVVRLVWSRAGCVPTYDTAGARVGHRMLRALSLELELYDASGLLVGRGSRHLDADTDVAGQVETAIAELGPID